MGIWDCWISCQKVCHLHRGCNGSAASAGACPHMASNTCSNGHSNTLLGCLRNAENLLDWLQTELSLPWACHQFTICYQMLSNVTSPWHLQPTFPPAHFFRGHGTWPMDFDDLDDAEETLGPKLVDLREQKRAASRLRKWPAAHGPMWDANRSGMISWSQRTCLGYFGLGWNMCCICNVSFQEFDAPLWSRLTQHDATRIFSMGWDLKHVETIWKCETTSHLCRF